MEDKKLEDLLSHVIKPWIHDELACFTAYQKDTADGKVAVPKEKPYAIWGITSVVPLGTDYRTYRMINDQYMEIVKGKREVNITIAVYKDCGSAVSLNMSLGKRKHILRFYDAGFAIMSKGGIMRLPEVNGMQFIEKSVFEIKLSFTSIVMENSTCIEKIADGEFILDRR